MFAYDKYSKLQSETRVSLLDFDCNGHRKDLNYDREGKRPANYRPGRIYNLIRLQAVADLRREQSRSEVSGWPHLYCQHTNNT